MKKILVVAPHPDDETIGCGGSLHREQEEGNHISWLIVTAANLSSGYSPEQTESQKITIKSVAEYYGFDTVHKLDFPAAKLDTVPISDLVAAMSAVFKEIEPEVVYLPHPSDAHSDHRICFQAGSACTKWFRHSSVKKVLAYETSSETNFSRDPTLNFVPNVYRNIENYLPAKLKALTLYESEIGEFPFPRSLEAISSLARLRGSESGFEAAEAFSMIFDRR